MNTQCPESIVFKVRLWVRLLKLSGSRIPEDGRIAFFRRDRSQFPFLSNFFYAPFELEGEWWPTVEHYYQAQKSTDAGLRKMILKRRTSWGFWDGRFYAGGYAKRTGASCFMEKKIFSKRSWFRKHPDTLRDDWDDIKLDVMKKAVRTKFMGNKRLKALLLNTDQALLVEDSINDSFWGEGGDGCGSNWLGRVLMDVREELLR